MQYRDLTELTDDDKDKIAGLVMMLRHVELPYPQIGHLFAVNQNTLAGWVYKRQVGGGRLVEDILGSYNIPTDTVVSVDTRRPHSHKIYLSGGISNRDYSQVQKEFSEAKRRLRRLKYEVASPLDNGIPIDSDWLTHMQADIAMMMECTAIYIVGDISTSKGANMELDLARKLGYKLLSYKYSDEKIEEVLRAYGKD